MKERRKEKERKERREGGEGKKEGGRGRKEEGKEGRKEGGKEGRREGRKGAQVILNFFVETGSHYLAQAGFEHLTSSDLPASAS